jgi:hypothetical protein
VVISIATTIHVATARATIIIIVIVNATIGGIVILDIYLLV